MVLSFVILILICLVDQLTPSTVSVTTSPSDTLPQPSEPTTKLPPSSSIRTNFKFTQEQKNLLLERFDAGLHYPTNAEKEQFAEVFGASAESVSRRLTLLIQVSRWFERTRKEKGVQRTKKLIPQDTKPQTPQYVPVQQQQPQILQTAPSQLPPNIMPQYTQFPSTYPYNTLNPQVFNQQQYNQTASQQGAMPPASGLYAPIPFINPSQPYVQTQPTHPQQSTIPLRPNFAVEITNRPVSREGVYVDDTRDLKRQKLAPAPGPTPIAPKPNVVKVLLVISN
jgi:hypothetical protein